MLLGAPPGLGVIHGSAAGTVVRCGPGLVGGGLGSGSGKGPGLELGAGSWLQCACHLAMIAVTAHVLPEPEATRVQHRDEGRTSDSQMGEG